MDERRSRDVKVASSILPLGISVEETSPVYFVAYFGNPLLVSPEIF